MYLMYFLSKMGVLQPAILVFQRVSIPNAPCMDYSPIEDGAIPAIASVSLLEFFFFRFSDSRLSDSFTEVGNCDGFVGNRMVGISQMHGNLRVLRTPPNK